MQDKAINLVALKDAGVLRPMGVNIPANQNGVSRNLSQRKEVAYTKERIKRHFCLKGFSE